MQPRIKRMLVPMRERIVIKRTATHQSPTSKIVIPDIAQEKPQEGEVIAVGPGRILPSGKELTPALAPGDQVLFGRYVGVDITIDGEDVIIMREDDILARLA